MGLIRGEPPTIFGDGKNIVIHQDEYPEGAHGEGSGGNAPTTGPEDSGAAGNCRGDDIAICADKGGEDDGHKMRDVSSQQQSSDDCAKDGEQAESVDMA